MKVQWQASTGCVFFYSTIIAPVPSDAINSVGCIAVGVGHWSARKKYRLNETFKKFFKKNFRKTSIPFDFKKWVVNHQLSFLTYSFWPLLYFFKASLKVFLPHRQDSSLMTGLKQCLQLRSSESDNPSVRESLRRCRMRWPVLLWCHPSRPEAAVLQRQHSSLPRTLHVSRFHRLAFTPSCVLGKHQP